MILRVYTLLIYVYIAIDNNNDMFLLKHEYIQSTYIKMKWRKKMTMMNIHIDYIIM